ncbi:hypothetical protein ACOME3_006304 [Neoechinorhynchus agilis]
MRNRNIDNVDVWIGGILEDSVGDGRIGPLFQCLLKKQFESIRNGDRFWYENDGVFSEDQLKQVKKSNLARIICANSDSIDRIPANVFIRSRFPDDYQSCESLEDIDLSPWINCCEENVRRENSICNTPSIYSYNPQPDLPSPYVATI